jgi:hypothetical protein
MIKSFKDFDDALKSQKIYEAVEDSNFEDNGDVIGEKDAEGPELLSDNKFLLKISRVVLRKLRKSGLGAFGLHPLVVNIDNIPGVHFYNYDDPTMNIVICRNTNVKYAYLFREFKMGEKNVADLVLSTSKLGFTDIIDSLISRLTPSNIEEALATDNWSFKGYGNVSVTKDDMIKCGQMSVGARKSILNKCLESSKGAGTLISWIPTQNYICKEIDKLWGGYKEQYVKKVSIIFYTAAKGDDTIDEKIVGEIKATAFNMISSKDSDIKEYSNLNAFLSDGSDIGTDPTTLKKDTEEFMKNMDQIYDIAKLMCKYVKNNCQLDKNDWGKMRKRGLLITGKAGAGKSKAVERALKESNMRENVDYFKVSSGNTSAPSLFKKFYDYNGKLLIFDDSAELFNASYKISFWKQALEANPDDATVELSSLSKDGEKIGDNIYIPGALTRQQRYYVEVGESSRKEKEAFRKEEFDRLEAQYRKETGDISSSLTDTQKAGFYLEVDRLWKEREEKKKPKMPNRFKYKGVVIVISNTSRDVFKQEVGGENWVAIDRRMRNFDLAPEAQSMWEYIKTTILAQTEDSSLSDDERLIPVDMVEELIKEVETLLEDKNYQNINFGYFADDMHKIFNSPDAIGDWKYELKKLMSI